MPPRTPRSKLSLVRHASRLGKLCALLVVWALPVLAAEPARVVVVPNGAGDPVAARVIDELIASGVTVEVTSASEGGLDALGRARTARAVVRVEPSRREVRLWTIDAFAVSAEETVLAEPGTDADAAARGLALRVVEMLRPRLVAGPSSSVPWPPAPLPSSGTSAVPSASAAPTAGSGAAAMGLPPAPEPLQPPVSGPAPWPDSLAIYVGPAILLRPATPLSPGAGGLWGFTKMITPYLGIDLGAVVPVVPAELSAADGHVKIASGSIGGAVLLRYPTVPSAVHVWGGLGLAAGFVGYDAEVTSTAVRASDGVVVHALPHVRAALEWRAWPSLGFRADVLAAIARPRPVLAVAGQPDTALEEPLIGLAAGVVVWLP